MPNALAVTADDSGDVGQLLARGVGDHGAVPVDQHTIGERHEEHTRDDGDAGLGLDDLERWSDGVGRRVRGARDHPVGEPEVDHHRAEVGDVGDHRAGDVDGHPLVPAEPGVLDGEALAQLGVERAEDRRLGQVGAERGGARADVRLFAEDGELRDLAAQQPVGGEQDPIVVALGQDDVRVGRARLLKEGVLEHQRRDDARAAHLEQVDERCAIHVLLEQGERLVVLRTGFRCQPAAAADDPNRGVVGAEVGGDDRQGDLESGHQLLDRLGQLETAVEQDACQRREGVRGLGEQGREQHLGAVAGHHDDGVLGEPGQHVDHRHAGHDDAEDRPVEHGLVALDQRAVGRGHQVAHGRCHEQPVFGDRPDRHRILVQGEADGEAGRRQDGRIDAVRDDREQLGMCAAQLADGHLRHLGQLVGGAGKRLAEAIRSAVGGPSAEHEDHRSAQVGGDARVEGELGRTADVGVVGAEHDDRAALRLDRLVALDDPGERRLGVGMHVVVGDADALVVAEVDAIVLEEQLQDVVPLADRSSDGTEDADPLDLAGEGVEHAEGDRRLPCIAFDGRDVDASCLDRHVPDRIDPAWVGLGPRLLALRKSQGPVGRMSPQRCGAGESRRCLLEDSH